MARQFEYVVYRKGSNSRNQSCTFEWVPIAIVRAPNHQVARETTWGSEKPSIDSCPTLAAEVLVSCGNLDVWSNQYLAATLKSKAPKRDIDILMEAAAEQFID